MSNLNTPQSFDLLEHQFQTGASLIEASAGTGKTFSIAMLVTRLVVEKAIPIDQILVVTFTKAATEELKERIRARLLEARNHLQEHALDSKSDSKSDSNSNLEPDPFLTQWCQQIERGTPLTNDYSNSEVSGEQDNRSIALKRIAMALADIDQAAIFTIHSFCQRILLEYPLESGQSFSGELSTNIDAQRDQVLQDFWRNLVYEKPANETAVLVNAIDQIAIDSSASNVFYSRLKQRLGPQLAKLGYLLQQLDAHSHIENAEQSLDELVQQSLLTQQKIDDFFDTLEPNLGEFIRAAEDNGWLNKNQINTTKTRYQERFNHPQEFFDKLPGAVLKAHKSKLDNVIDLANLPAGLFAQQQKLQKQLPLAIIQQLMAFYFDALNQQLDTENALSFDDLIQRLAQALTQADKSAFLVQQIQARFQAAFIDEFQDTDLQQWKIFSTLFANSHTYLYLIGDPKQAIYKFRGADIYAYLQAKKACEYHYTLDTNWRSVPNLVEAVNHLFERQDDPFLTADLQEIGDFPFHRVNAGKEDNQDLEVCHLWEMPPSPEKKAWNAEPAQTLIRENILAHISRQLQNGAQPKEFAVLVRGNKTAALYQTEFLKLGIPAVINSKESVYQSEQALELLSVMQALHEPADIRKAKQALATRWFGFSAQQLLQAVESDTLEVWLDSLFEHHKTWQQKGFMAAIYGLLDEWQVRQHLAMHPMGERNITNIFHLVELLQKAALQEHLNMTKTLQLLESHTQKPPAGDDEILRLETDEEALQIVTLHSSKGLQYKYVYCPDLWAFKGLKETKLLVSQENGQTILDLGSTKFEGRKKRIEHELQAEDMRLIYVALTRAEERLYIVYGESLKEYSGSPLGKLLGKELPQKTGFVQQQLELEPQALPYQANQQTVSFAARAFERQNIQTRRRVFSFSGLVKNRPHETPHDKSQEDHELEQKISELKISTSELPKGAEFGNLVHALLEKSRFDQLADGVDESLRQMLSDQYGVRWAPERLKREAQLASFDSMMRNIVKTPLDLDRPEFTLGKINQTRILKEMGFFYAISPTATPKLNQLIAQTDIPFSPLASDAIDGYLNGFIDLIVEFEGKFYIMDYKTNYLGNDPENYSMEIMHQEMSHHSYGLQFTLYTLAVHQYLKTRLPEYDYETHFGGIKYLFVRGMNGHSAEHGIYSYRPKLELILALESLIRDQHYAA